MQKNGLQNGQVGESVVRQQYLLEIGGEALREVAGKKSSSTSKPRGPKRPIARDTGGVETIAVAQLLRDELTQIKARLVGVESLLSAILEKVIQGNVVKEYYTTQDVARILSKRPYTVREWCRLGRVRGEKSHSGRGVDEEWRISHEELMRIQNEGLLPVAKCSGVERPRRLK